MSDVKITVINNENIELSVSQSKVNVSVTAPTVIQVATNYGPPGGITNVNSGKILGRFSAGTGSVQEITIGSGLALVGSSLEVSGSFGITQLTGDVVAGPGSGSVATTISNQAVTYAKIQDLSTNDILLGRATSGSGSVEEIIIGSGLLLSGNTLSAPSAGSVTSVALALPVSVFTVSGSPITSTGTLTGSFSDQSANTVFSGPTTGSAATPAFRSLVAADIPNIAESQVIGLVSDLSGKQATGNYITDLTGDGSASGPGSVSFTLATVNSNTGSFGSASSVSTFTVNAKGLITAAGSTPILITESQVTGLVSDLASKVPNTRAINTTSPITGGGDLSADRTIAIPAATSSVNGYLTSTDWSTFNNKQTAGNYITALTGDGTASGPGSIAFTLATVNSNVGSFGGATSVSTFTVNGKGLVTAAGSTSIQIAESQVTSLVSDLASKQASIPTGTGVKFVNKNGTDSASTGNIQNPCLTIQQALTNIGDSASNSDVAQPWTVFIAPGVYDEDLTIPKGRIITLVAQGTVILGNGLGSNWASTNTRNIGWSISTADTFTSDLKPALNIVATPASDATSTFIAEAGCFYVSGNINITGSGGLTNTLNTSNVKLAGNLVHNNVSLTNWQCYRSIITGTVTTTGTLTLERAYDSRFNSLVSIQGYNMVMDCNFAAGMTVQAAVNNVIPSGMFCTSFTGTFTGPASSLKLDLVSDYFFITNGASLAGGATKVLLSKTDQTLTVGQLIDSGLTASTVPYADSSKQLTSSAVTPTELGYVSGVTSAIQTQLGNKQPLDATLTALAAYNTNGILTQTAADTFLGRTIAGTTNRIGVTNGDGVSGNPTLDIGSDVVTLTGSQVLTNKTLTGNTAVNLISGSGTFVHNTTGTITAPNATDTLVGKATTDVLTNKTIDAGSNTVSNLTNTNLSGSASITNANLASMATLTIKGNNTGGGSVPIDLTASQVRTVLALATVATSGLESDITSSVVTKTANYPATSTDVVILVDTTSTAVTITLPTAVGYIHPITIKDSGGNTGTNVITITRTSSQKIDNTAADYIIITPFASVTLVSDNANWWII